MYDSDSFSSAIDFQGDSAYIVDMHKTLFIIASIATATFAGVNDSDRAPAMQGIAPTVKPSEWIVRADVEIKPPSDQVALATRPEVAVKVPEGAGATVKY